MQLTINQLRAQIAEAKAAHEVQLVEARRAEQGRGDGVEAHGQHELAALPAAQATDGIVQVACLAAELRLEELTAVAAREEAERQREAARIARAELRTQMQMLRTQVAARQCQWLLKATPRFPWVALLRRDKVARRTTSLREVQL